MTAQVPDQPPPIQLPEVNRQFAVMLDAAYAQDLDGTDANAVGGYLDSPNALHPWSSSDWAGIPGPKLPIWVAGDAGEPEAETVLSQLTMLGVPMRGYVAVDMETRVDVTYVTKFGAILQHNRYRVLVYGSAETVFQMPQLNGYWVAGYLDPPEPYMYPHQGVRATQWEAGTRYDTSAIKSWVLRDFWQ